jgi:membrane protease YdiL (CAAX protease family)
MAPQTLTSTAFFPTAGVAAAVLAGVAWGMVGPEGVLAAVVLCATGVWHARQRDAALPAALFGLTALAMALHALPGFGHPLLVSAVKLAPDAAPFLLYLNVDKGLAGLALAMFACGPCASACTGMTLCRRVVAHALITTGVVLGLAWLLGIVRFEPRWWGEPSWLEVTWRFLVVNLLFTCVAEEAFFRGLVQGWLTRRLSGKGWPAWPAVVVSALLFGLAHAGGGWRFAGLAMLAGLGYGWVRLRTGRVGAAVTVHFALNAVHFLCLTYPRLA